MYLNANNEEEPVSTFSRKEVFGFIFIVLLLLYALFPEEGLTNSLHKTKQENTNLSIEYLEGMLKGHPHNIFLKKKLMQQYQLNGEPEKSLALARDLLTKTKEKKELKELYQQEYFLLKEIYFKDNKIGSSQQLNELKKKLQKFHLTATGAKDYQFLFTESTSMNFQQLRYDVLKVMLKESKEEEHHALEKEAFYLAASLNYNEEAYAYLSSVLKSIKNDLPFQEKALLFLIKSKKPKEAEILVLDLIKQDKEHSKRLEHFKIAFYMLMQNKKINKVKIKNLVELYQLHASLKSSDLFLLSNALLQIKEDKKAADLMYENFQKKRELFDENTSKEAIRVLSYNQQLTRALEISNYTYKEYPSVENLDSSIALSTWVSKIDKAIALNIEGYRKFDNPKYERYLLEETSFDHAYKIRGEIYRTKIKKGNFSMVNEMGNYFEYTGEIKKAIKYFDVLVKKYPKKNIYEEAIRFNHYDNRYVKMAKLYDTYQQKFGSNKKIHKKIVDEALAKKKFNVAYQFAKQLKILDPHLNEESKTKEGLYAAHHIPDNSNLKLKQMAWIKKDYNYLHQLLWIEEPLFTQSKNDYEVLIKLEKNLLEKPKLQYLYARAWETTSNKQYLEDLLSLHLKTKSYKKFNTTIVGLSPKNRASLEKFSSFHLLLANYYDYTLNKKEALSSFQTAVYLAPKDSMVHADYIWFLIKHHYQKELHSEVTHLQKSTQLQQKLIFPSVLAALKINKSDLALKWLKPLLKKNKAELEYQLLYSDILDLQGKSNAARSIQSKLFKQLHTQLESSVGLQKDKKIVSLYLELLLNYNKLSSAKKKGYVEKFKSLFSDKEYLKTILQFYTSINNVKKVSYLVKKHKLNWSWLNLYLATRRGDKSIRKAMFSKNKHELSLEDKVATLLELGKANNAYSLLFQSMKNNQSNQAFMQNYWELINAELPKNDFTLLSEQISKNIRLESMRFAGNYTISNDLNLGLKLSKDRFVETNKGTKVDNSVALSLANRKGNFLWDMTLGKTFGVQHYNHAAFGLTYNFEKVSLEIDLQHNKMTQLTPYLEVNAVKDSFDLTLNYELNSYNQFNLSYNKSNYHLKNGKTIGDGEQLKFSNTHITRLGYPDISFYNYLNIHHLNFEQEERDLRSFTEIGSELTLGHSAKNGLTKSWKPYMSLGVAVNNHKEVGTSVSLGTAGMLYQADKLDISLQYTKGINNIAEERFGVFLKYSY